MTKSDLRTGHIVTYRDGQKRTVFLNTCNAEDYITDGTMWHDLMCYNEDLTCSSDSNLDIVKVEQAYMMVDICKDPKTLTGLKTIWEREEVKKMTVSEIEAILGYKIEIIAEKENYYE